MHQLLGQSHSSSSQCTSKVSMSVASTGICCFVYRLACRIRVQTEDEMHRRAFFSSSRRNSRRKGRCLTTAVLAPASQIADAGKLELLQNARVITAIKTPYQRNGKFDLEAYDQIVEHQIQVKLSIAIYRGCCQSRLCQVCLSAWLENN